MATVTQGGPVMAPVELECPVVGCTLGEDGGRYKTPPVPGIGITQELQLHNPQLNNLHGDQLDFKTEEQLLAEMRTLAIVAQNHLVNIVRVRSLVQDRDEPIRSYLARLKGVAAVCRLTLQL